MENEKLGITSNKPRFVGTKEEKIEKRKKKERKKVSYPDHKENTN